MNQNKPDQFENDLKELETTISEANSYLNSINKQTAPTIQETLKSLTLALPLLCALGYFIHILFPQMDSDALAIAIAVVMGLATIIWILLYAWLYPRYLRKRANMSLQPTGQSARSQTEFKRPAG